MTLELATTNGWRPDFSCSNIGFYQLLPPTHAMQLTCPPILEEHVSGQYFDCKLNIAPVNELSTAVSVCSVPSLPF
jgi:hypothetical protein